MINYLTSLVKPHRCSVSCISSTERKKKLESNL